jgi:xanthine dehydrogenase YagR molybdenum-binding subunit
MLLAIGQLKAAIQQNAKRQPVAGSNAPWREMLAASPDLSASSVRPEDSRPTAPGVQVAAEAGRFHGHDLRLDDAAFLQSGDRRGGAEFGAGHRGRSRHLARAVRVVNVHTGIAIGKVAAPALAHSQAAGSVIQGVGYALYEAREIDSRTRRYPQRRHGGLTASRGSPTRP